MRATMKIRDSHATLSNDEREYEMTSGGLEIISDDGRTLFCIELQKDGSLRVDSGSFCKHNGRLLEDRIQVMPRAANVIEVSRPFYLDNKREE